MIRAILIDDEVYIREIVREQLVTNFNDTIEIVGEAGSVKDGVALIKEQKPDLLFLDIQLKDGTSFDILSQIDYKEFNLIFITGFDDHAIKAIKVGALDYIIKPIDTSEFNEAVVKVLHSNKDNFTEKSIEVSRERFTNTITKKRIILKTLENIFIVFEDDIYYCKSEGNYTTVYTNKNTKIVVSKPIKAIEELLSNDVFIRCHKSYLINKNHVIQYNKNGLLIINEDHKVPVSSRRKDTIIQEIFK